MSTYLEGPRLARELERLIFMEAANASVYTASVLGLVARRVQAWTEPILYRILMIDPDLRWPPLKRLTHPVNLSTVLSLLEKYGHHVQHLHFCSSLSKRDLSKVLNLCPNVVDLCICQPIGVDLMHAAGKMKLRKFSGNLVGFKRYTLGRWDDEDDEDNKETRLAAKKDAIADLTVWANTLTHLELMNASLSSTTPVNSFLQNLKSLTYLSVHPDLIDHPEVQEHVLKECKSLRVLAYVETMSALLDEEDEPSTFAVCQRNPETQHLREEFETSGDPLTLESRLLSCPTTHLVKPVDGDDSEEPRVLTMYSKFTEDWLKTALSYDLGGGTAKDLWDTADEAVQERLTKAKQALAAANAA